MSINDRIPQPFCPISCGDWTLYNNLLVPKKRLLLTYFQKLDTLTPDDPILTFTFPTSPPALEIHKSRLALIGGPLTALITAPFRECAQRAIHLPHDHPHTFAAIRAFLYLHPLDLGPHLHDSRLPLAAHRWQLRGLFRAWLAARRLAGLDGPRALYRLWDACVLLPLPRSFRAFLGLAFASHFAHIMADLGVGADRAVGEDRSDPDQMLKIALERVAVEFASSSTFILFAELARDAAHVTPTMASALDRPSAARGDGEGKDGSDGEHPRSVNRWLNFARCMTNASSRAQVLHVAHEAAAYALRSHTLPQLVRAMDKQGFRNLVPTHIRCEQIWALFHDVIAILTADAYSLRHRPQLTAAPAAAALPHTELPHSSVHHNSGRASRLIPSKRTRPVARDEDDGHSSPIHPKQQQHMQCNSVTPTAPAATAAAAAAAPSMSKRPRLSHQSTSLTPPPHVPAPTSHIGCTATAAAPSSTHPVTPVSSSIPAAAARAGASSATRRQQQRQRAKASHVPIPSVDALWDMFYERGLLRYVVYYVSRYCEKNYSSALLRGILQSLESKLTDVEAIALLKLLDWEKPDLPALLSNINRSFSGHALRLLTVAQAEVLARGDSELRFSFKLKNLVNRIGIRYKKLKFETAEHAFRDYRFVARVSCNSTERNTGPLIVGISLVKDAMQLPNDVIVHARVRAIIDGCGCEPEPRDGRDSFFGVEGVPANYESSRTGTNLMMFARQSGEIYTLYSGTKFREWLNSHTEACSLKVFVTLRFGSANSQDSTCTDCVQAREPAASRVVSCHCGGLHSPVVLDGEDSDDSDEERVADSADDEAYNSELENELEEEASDDS